MGCRRVASVPACEPRLNHPVSVEVCHLAAPAYVRAANPVVECAQQHSAKGLRSCLLNGKWLLVARLYLDRSRGRQPCTINGMADRRCALTRYPQTRVRVLRSTTRRHGTGTLPPNGRQSECSTEVEPEERPAGSTGDQCWFSMFSWELETSTERGWRCQGGFKPARSRAG